MQLIFGNCSHIYADSRWTRLRFFCLLPPREERRRPPRSLRYNWNLWSIAPDIPVSVLFASGENWKWIPTAAPRFAYSGLLRTTPDTEQYDQTAECQCPASSSEVSRKSCSSCQSFDRPKWSVTLWSSCHPDPTPGSYPSLKRKDIIKVCWCWRFRRADLFEVSSVKIIRPHFRQLTGAVRQILHVCGKALDDRVVVGLPRQTPVDLVGELLHDQTELFVGQDEILAGIAYLPAAWNEMMREGHFLSICAAMLLGWPWLVLRRYHARRARDRRMRACCITLLLYVHITNERARERGDRSLPLYRFPASDVRNCYTRVSWILQSRSFIRILLSPHNFLRGTDFSFRGCVLRVGINARIAFLYLHALSYFVLKLQ